MKYNNEIEFEHNILKNIYIIYILQDFFKDDSDIHTKKILFKCNIFNNDKNRIKGLEENLVNNNIKGNILFKRNDLNEKVINDMKFSKKKRYRRTKAEMIKIKEE